MANTGIREATHPSAPTITMPSPSRPALLWDLLTHRAAQRAAHTALVDPTGELSYRSLVERAEALAGWLTAQGVEHGDRVGLALGPCTLEVVALMAVARLDAVFVGVFHRWKTAQVLHVLEDSGARVLLVGPKQARDLAQAGLPASLERMVVMGPAPSHPKACGWPEDLAPRPLPAPPTAPRALRALLYTSGSTGQPKGVMISDEALVTCAHGVVDYLDYSPSERVLAAMPLCFSYGLSQVTSALAAGATAVLHRASLPAELLATMARQQVTVLAGVPAFWHLLLTALEDHPAPLPALRLITNAGGAPTRRMSRDLPRLLPGVGIVLLYGQTEMLRGTWLPPERFVEKPGAMGVPVPDQQLWLVDAAKGLCAPGQVGEVVVHGPMVCQGYWGRPDQTAEHLRPSPWLQDSMGDQPVWHSGDIAERDDDGVLWFRGRQDSLIKTAGFRVSPTEIEDVATAVAGVQDAVAFGEPHPRLGQAVVLVVSPGPGGTIDPQALRTHFLRQLPAYMAPSAIHVLAEGMPRISTGKVDRKAVITAHQAPAPTPDGSAG